MSFNDLSKKYSKREKLACARNKLVGFWNTYHINILITFAAIGLILFLTYYHEGDQAYKEAAHHVAESYDAKEAQRKKHQADWDSGNPIMIKHFQGAKVWVFKYRTCYGGDEWVYFTTYDNMTSAAP